jgi:hypothetical protein
MYSVYLGIFSPIFDRCIFSKSLRDRPKYVKGSTGLLTPDLNIDHVSLQVCTYLYDGSIDGCPLEHYNHLGMYVQQG